MVNESGQPITTEEGEPDVMGHEASIWEVLRKSEEKIRLEKKKLTKEKVQIDRIKEGLLREMDDVAKLKDDIIAQKNEAIKERDRLFALKDEFATQKGKLLEVKARLDEQRLNLEARITEVNQKIQEVEERSNTLTEREKNMLSAAEEFASKKEELVRWEEEIIDKEKEITNKMKPLLEKETDLQNRERDLNERELSLSQEKEIRVTKTKALIERDSKLLAREKAIEEQHDKLITYRMKLAERESRLLTIQEIPGGGEEFKSIESLSPNVGGEELAKMVDDLEMGEVAPPPMYVPLDKPIRPGLDSSALDLLSDDTPKETELAELEEEMPCPTCGTMISMVATTCFACGMEIKTESVEEKRPIIPEESLSVSTAGPQEEPSIESEFLEFEEKEVATEPKLPTIEELNDMSMDELVARCEILGLDPSGKEKHLRRRLLAYIKGPMSSEEQKAPVVLETSAKPSAELSAKPSAKPTVKRIAKPSAEPPVKLTVKPPAEPQAEESVKAPACSDCGEELIYIDQYSRWYCYACEKYAPRVLK